MISSALAIFPAKPKPRQRGTCYKLRWPVTYACAQSNKPRHIIAFPNVKEHIFNYYESNNLLTLLSLDYENKERGRNSKLSTLMVYGDSIGVHYYRLATNRPLCKEIFRTCSKKYMWTYDVSWKILMSFLSIVSSFWKSGKERMLEQEKENIINLNQSKNE